MNNPNRKHGIICPNQFFVSLFVDIYTFISLNTTTKYQTMQFAFLVLKIQEASVVCRWIFIQSGFSYMAIGLRKNAKSIVQFRIQLSKTQTSQLLSRIRKPNNIHHEEREVREVKSKNSIFLRVLRALRG